MPIKRKMVPRITNANAACCPISNGLLENAPKVLWCPFYQRIVHGRQFADLSATLRADCPVSPDLSANRPSSFHSSNIKAPSCSDAVQIVGSVPVYRPRGSSPSKCGSYPAKNKDSRRSASSSISPGTRFLSSSSDCSNPSLPQQRLGARGDHGGSTRYIGEQQTQKKRIVG